MKKKINNTHTATLLLLPLLWMTGCSDWLVLHPEDSIIEEEYWQTGSQVESVVRNCYRLMQEDNFMQRLILWGELRADNTEAGSSLPSAASDIINANVKSSNTWSNWASFYTVINCCNKVIESAPDVMKIDANFTQVTCEAYLAEAYTLRALCYFYLVRTFREVPLVLSSSKTDQQDYNVSNRDTTGWMTYYKIQDYRKEQYPMVDQEFYVIDHMIADLTLAQDYAASFWDSDSETYGRITKNAVKALLADYYLWRAAIALPLDATQSAENYRTCIALCNEVINDPTVEWQWAQGSALLNKIFYSGNSTESIFELNFTTNGHANNGTSTVYGNKNKNKSGQLMAASTLPGCFNKNKVEDDPDYDYRSKDFFNATTKAIFKYEGQTPPNDFGGTSYTFRASSNQANWIFYRLADLYLMKAEALAQLASTGDETSEVVSLCNVTYIRACTVNNEVKDSLSHSTYSTVSDVRKLVLAERQRELMFEGKRWFDLLRLARSENSTANAWDYIEGKYDENITTIKNKMTAMDAWYLPIYHDEMKININLKQNTYYASQQE